MRYIQLCITITLTILGAACADDKNDPSKNNEPPVQDTAKSEQMESPKGVIPQSQLDALKKAKSVENALKEAEEKRQQEQEGI